MLNYPTEAYLGSAHDWCISNLPLFSFFLENWGVGEVQTLDTWFILPSLLFSWNREGVANQNKTSKVKTSVKV